MKIVIVLLFLCVVGSLASAGKYLLRDHGTTDRMAWALTWRIGLSVLLFVFLLVAHWLGWIDSTGLRTVSGS
ncbi:MAG: twin transmembrane helix small protein [Alcaligenaceae bacterium]|nr:twin transmembrane helix small protein [Alcaligenaceae bacterium]